MGWLEADIEQSASAAAKVPVEESSRVSVRVVALAAVVAVADSVHVALEGEAELAEAAAIDCAMNVCDCRTALSMVALDFATKN